jgi:uncharacterized RDD family membrane protein YckC
LRSFYRMSCFIHTNTEVPFPPPPSLPPSLPPSPPSHRRYIRLKTSVCILIAVFVGASLSLLRVPFAGLFGLITFVFNYIPNVRRSLPPFLPPSFCSFYFFPFSDL